MTYKISRAALQEYIKHEQIAFQFIDGLMTFTHLEKGCNEECDAEAVSEMQQKMESFCAIRVVTREEAANYGFEELSQWAQEQDALLLVDDVLLLCLPQAEYAKIFKAA